MGHHRLRPVHPVPLLVGGRHTAMTRRQVVGGLTMRAGVECHLQKIEEPQRLKQLAPELLEISRTGARADSPLCATDSAISRIVRRPSTCCTKGN